MAQFPHTSSQLLSGAVGTIKSIQDRGNTRWRPEPGRRMSSDIPLLRVHITSPHTPTLHTHEEGMRRDTGSSMVAPGSACASVSLRAQAPPQSPRLLDSYFDGVRGSNCREGSEQDAEEALVSEGVLCGGYRRHQRVIFGVSLAEGQELGRCLRHLRAPRGDVHAPPRPAPAWAPPLVGPVPCQAPPPCPAPPIARPRP